MSLQTVVNSGPGRPKGAKTGVSISKMLLRQSLKAVCERARAGDVEAQNLLVQAAIHRPEWAGLEAKRGHEDVHQGQSH